MTTEVHSPQKKWLWYWREKPEYLTGVHDLKNTFLKIQTETTQGVLWIAHTVRCSRIRLIGQWKHLWTNPSHAECQTEFLKMSKAKALGCPQSKALSVVTVPWGFLHEIMFKNKTMARMLTHNYCQTSREWRVRPRQESPMETGKQKQDEL